MAGNGKFSIGVEIGGLPISFHTDDPRFAGLLEQRYANFLSEPGKAALHFEVTIAPMPQGGVDDPVVARRDASGWHIGRGDFEAGWVIATGRGTLRQSLNPWSSDSALRIAHSLLLAERGGFLLHAASAIRGDRAFLFSGVSGAGKSTITRLAPPDVVRLTDEISYIRKIDGRYMAFGTPFSGELETPGANVAAPVAALHFLAQGSADEIGPITREHAARRLMRNILFFTTDPDLAARVLWQACDFLEAVPSDELTFRPQAEVWRLVA
jgi:hypothetical protein